MPGGDGSSSERAFGKQDRRSAESGLQGKAALLERAKSVKLHTQGSHLCQKEENARRELKTRQPHTCPPPPRSHTSLFVLGIAYVSETEKSSIHGAAAMRAH